MQIGILADTHLAEHHLKQKGYQTLLDRLNEIFKGVDHIIHAGDVCAEQFLRDLEKIAPVTYCRGNCDRNNSWARKIQISLENIEIGIAHAPEDIALFAGDDIRVFIHGHTHFPSIQETPENILVICPGSLLNPRPRASNFRFLEDEVPRPSVAFLLIENEQVSAFIKKL